MTTTQSPATVHQDIAAAATTPDRDIRYLREIKPGQHCRQGDVYLLCVASRPSCYAKPTANRQLAPGQSKGSRHIVDGAVAIFTADERQAREAIRSLPGSVSSRLTLPGPCVEATERFTLTHPEHAHHSLPAGVYVVLYQLDPRSMRRVED